MKILWIDTETYSEVPINRGTDVYARPVEIMIVAYAIDAGEVRVWDCTDGSQMPQDLYDALSDTSVIIVAHNAYFDRTVMYWAWPEWRDFVNVIERWHCTMAQAYAHSLPGALALLCEVLQVRTRKQEGGKELINLFCKPRPKRDKLRRATRETHPEKWAQFMSYAGDDVGAMRDCYYAMPMRNYTGDEKAFWCLDQEMNDYGFAVDTDFMSTAIEALRADKQELDARARDLTKTDDNPQGIVTTQRDKLIKLLLDEYVVSVDSLRADDLEELIANDETLPAEVVELLQLRIMSAMNSTAKFTRLQNCVGPDGRLRGTRQFNGASRTGRSAGRIFNPLNLRRPTMEADDIARCIQLIKDGHADLVPLFADSLREACSNGLRGLVIAPPGKKLVISDWSNIEGRVAAWLTGENWKLDAFRAFDTIVGVDAKGKPLRAGPDLYKLIYSRSFGVLIEAVTEFMRQIGKGEELSMQYGGGVGAFIAVSYSYGLDLDELAVAIPKLAPYEALFRAARIWEWAVEKKRTLGLTREQYIACETVKSLWRQANPNMVQGWEDLESAAKQALTYPGEVFTACRCTFEFKAKWLMVKLPSGRYLMYPSPRILANGSLAYGGQVKKQWVRIKTYGGKLLENITQAVARDILKHSMLRVEREYGVTFWKNCSHVCEDGSVQQWREGYDKNGVRIVLDVYDEIVCEVPETSAFDLPTLNAIMVDAPVWAAGLPLAAEGFETQRYAKH